MKKKLSTFMVGIALLLASACTKTEYDLFGNITGTVMDKDTGEPLGQVAVTLSNGGLNTYTGSDGYFVFKELEAGDCRITMQKTDYQANYKDIKVLAGETVNVSITMKKQ